MITLAASGSPLRTAHYLHHKDTVAATKSLVEEAGDCCYCSCDTVIPALVNLSDTSNKFENDYFSWILKVPANNTVVATLTKVDTGAEYTITNNDFGTLYAVDSLKDNVWGLIIQWRKVAALHGYGNYQLNIQVSNVVPAVIFDKDYPVFCVMPYTCESAHGTVRIETYNTGYIEGGFDYRNLNFGGPPNAHQYGVLKGWGQQIRWYGRLDIVNHPTEIDNIYDNYRDLKQVQTQIEDEYNLRLDFIKTDISKQIIKDNFLADFILLSDYNADNVDDYKNVKVSLLSVGEPQPFRNKTILYNIKFVSFRQNNLKRHY